MINAPTPGEIAYAAWWRIRCGLPQGEVLYGFQQLPLVEQHAWDAAAQAVLDAWQAQPRLEDDTPCAS